MKTEITLTVELGVGSREAIAQLVHAIETAARSEGKGKKNEKRNAQEGGEDAEEKSNIDVSELKEGKKKRGRPTKEKAEETETDVEEETEEELEESETEETETDVEETEDFEEDEEEADTIGDADVSKLKAALRAYSAKHSKTKAVAILEKFAPTSAKVKCADLPKLLKLLKV